MFMSGLRSFKSRIFMAVSSRKATEEIFLGDAFFLAFFAIPNSTSSWLCSCLRRLGPGVGFPTGDCDGTCHDFVFAEGLFMYSDNLKTIGLSPCFFPLIPLFFHFRAMPKGSIRFEEQRNLLA